jgi:hypothetical protein
VSAFVHDAAHGVALDVRHLFLEFTVVAGADAGNGVVAVAAEWERAAIS